MARGPLTRPYYDRCVWTVRLRDGSPAQCQRRRLPDGRLCRQHEAMDTFTCEFCGGNDAYPQEHTMDCTRPKVGQEGDRG